MYRFNAKSIPSAFLGTNLVFGGSDGAAGYGYSILSSTNLALPLTNWSLAATGVFNSDGNFAVTNILPPGAPQRFYDLGIP
jgi:hypothetical protein